jgi:hypothetical protein
VARRPLAVVGPPPLAAAAAAVPPPLLFFLEDEEDIVAVARPQRCLSTKSAWLSFLPVDDHRTGNRLDRQKIRERLFFASFCDVPCRQ